MVKKILIIRFSAIGDIVLTSAVIRCLKKTHPTVELHFLVKHKFKEAINGNIYVNKIHCFSVHPSECVDTLTHEKFDVVIDLQKNRKSMRLRAALGAKVYTFPKLNIQKFLFTVFKVNKMPKIHVVDRYFKAVEKLGVQNDGQGLDFFIHVHESTNLPAEEFPFVALVVGATYYTKRIPLEKLMQIVSNIKSNVILLGGPDEKDVALAITQKFQHVKSKVGEISLHQSAYYLQKATAVITADTGLMHIAAAFNKPIVSVWGNTVPDFGMYAYMPKHPERNVNVEVQNLRCRPCSKLGYNACPKKHFKCMQQQDAAKIAGLVAEQGL